MIQTASTVSPAEFLTASSFDGAKPGYVFRSGDRGNGYYMEEAVAGRRRSRRGRRGRRGQDEDEDEDEEDANQLQTRTM